MFAIFHKSLLHQCINCKFTFVRIQIRFFTAKPFVHYKYCIFDSKITLQPLVFHRFPIIKFPFYKREKYNEPFAFSFKNIYAIWWNHSTKIKQHSSNIFIATSVDSKINYTLSYVGPFRKKNKFRRNSYKMRECTSCLADTVEEAESNK